MKIGRRNTEILHFENFPMLFLWGFFEHVIAICDAMRQDIEKRTSVRTSSDTNRLYDENRMSIRRRTAKLSWEEEIQK